MKIKTVIFSLLSGLSVSVASETKNDNNARLWYTKPAAEWTDALPVGNGRLGAMVFGRTNDELISLNEDTLYKGEPHDYSQEGAVDHLDDIRKFLFAGDRNKAEALANKKFMSKPYSQIPYQPLGNLHLRFDGHEKATEYERSLDLNTAMAVTEYQVGEVQYKREIIASFPDDVIAVRVSASKPGQLNFRASLSNPHPSPKLEDQGNGTISLSGAVENRYVHGSYRIDSTFENPMKYHTILKAQNTGGSVVFEGGALVVKGADSVLLLLTAETSYVNFRDVSGDPKAQAEAIMAQLAGKDWEELKSAHLEDYQALYQRVSIGLAGTEKEKLPTDERLIAATTKDEDPGLAALIFQYGRYLMIASSRPGSQPANLQGIWNDKTNPPWGSRYTVNINTQMNYWPAEVTNLAECHYPLLDALLELAESGKSVAKNHYGARGWVLHHNFDLWRGAAPINGANHGLWVTGGAWLCQHIWWHYEYGEDLEFLKKYYPVMREAAVFFTDFLIEDPRNDKGWLISTPSHSPENGGLVAGATMDHQLIRDLFNNVIKASEALGEDAELRAQLQSMVPKIAPNQIGKHGQLQEWLEDKDNPKNKHRHVSHLWGFHPGDEINWQDTPELFEAAKQSLNFRGDAATGWSMGWKMNFWARFLDGDRTKKIYDNLTSLSGGKGISMKRGGGLYSNLFCAHPPFQIDGNFGATAGIAEMVIQNHIKTKEGHRLIHLLPAVPTVWQTEGHLTGLRARGGIEVDVFWKEGKLVKGVLRSNKDQKTTIKVGEVVKSIDLKKGEETVFTL